MKRLLLLTLAALTVLVPVASTSAIGLSINIGDRPYYNRGSYYVEHGRRYVWVPGHWTRRHHERVWVHGHYALSRRGNPRIIVR